VFSGYRILPAISLGFLASLSLVVLLAPPVAYGGSTGFFHVDGPTSPQSCYPGSKLPTFTGFIASSTADRLVGAYLSEDSSFNPAEDLLLAVEKTSGTGQFKLDFFCPKDFFDDLDDDNADSLDDGVLLVVDFGTNGVPENTDAVASTTVSVVILTPSSGVIPPVGTLYGLLAEVKNEIREIQVTLDGLGGGGGGGVSTEHFDEVLGTWPVDWNGGGPDWDNVAQALADIKTEVDALAGATDIATAVWAAASRTLTGAQATALGFLGSSAELTAPTNPFPGNVDTIAEALREIKVEINAIEAAVSGISVGATPYVPFSVAVTGTCDVAGGPADLDRIIINGDSDLMVTGVLLRSAGVDEVADSIFVDSLRVDDVPFFIASEDLTGSATIANANLDIMGLTRPPSFVGAQPRHMPTTVAATGAGTNDLEIFLTCDSSTTSDITWASILVSGWRKADDTITVTYDEVLV
jgi:hypothetical protein